MAVRWPIDRITARRMLFTLWPRVQAFVNGPEPVQDHDRGYWLRGTADLWRDARRLFDRHLQGDPVFFPGGQVRFPRRVPLWTQERGVVEWDVIGSHFAGESINGVPASEPAWYDDMTGEVNFVLLLLQHNETRRLLRRCKNCGGYFLLKRVRRNPKGSSGRFCSLDCSAMYPKTAQGRADSRERSKRYYAPSVVRRISQKRMCKPKTIL